jgi:hypothetical protein
MHLDQIKGTKQFATFALANGETVGGEFLLDGRGTHVALYTSFQTLARSGDFVTLHATLPAGDCVSFLHCIIEVQEAHRVRLYPHFVTLGRRPLPAEIGIRRLGVVVDDFADIYYDFRRVRLRSGAGEAYWKHIGELLRPDWPRGRNRRSTRDRLLHGAQSAILSPRAIWPCVRLT